MFLPYQAAGDIKHSSVLASESLAAEVRSKNDFDTGHSIVLSSSFSIRHADGQYRARGFSLSPSTVRRLSDKTKSIYPMRAFVGELQSKLRS